MAENSKTIGTITNGLVLEIRGILDPPLRQTVRSEAEYSRGK